MEFTVPVWLSIRLQFMSQDREVEFQEKGD